MPTGRGRAIEARSLGVRFRRMARDEHKVKRKAQREVQQRVHGRDPVDMVAHGDTGCYTMLMFAPTEQLMHNYSGMGLGAGTGSGIDPFISNKQIVFMGDGTFFHSGQIAISNASRARSVRRWLASCQPTIMRENASITNAA